MAGNYKTPGVYVEEISKFPPSIAAVETAIPTFIGYTEKAIKNGESVTKKAIRIESIAEYELWFGGAPSQDVTVVLDSNNQFVKANAKAKLFMYDSLRMFYANGGGNCYIISVGAYPPDISTMNTADLEAALAVLALEDEPTIILAPDAVSTSGGPYGFQQLALGQCKNLMDRVAICDLVHDNDFKVSVANFRDKIGINNLNYGAAYGPWIHANLPRKLLRRNISLVDNGANPISLKSLTADTDINKLIDDLLKVEGSIGAISTAEISSNLAGAGSTIEAKLKSLVAAFESGSAATAVSKMNDIVAFVLKIVVEIKTLYDSTYYPVPTQSRFKIKDDIINFIASTGIVTIFQTLVHHNFATDNHTADVLLIPATSSTDLATVSTFLGLVAGAADPTITALYAATPGPAAVLKQNICITAKPTVLIAANAAITMFRFIENTQKNYEKNVNDTLLSSFGLYKEIVGKAGEALNLLPSSGAIAGVYAAVDRDRGVWKAPANVSLNAVIAPAVKISHEQQAEYNVDVNAGKSINIIRSFTGKGTLVWGARTLAGNDNEWRYISVRRFFNFAEESIKKATEQFVFEPNDANTWVRVQAMIENFLNTLWRQGALQGVKPEHAFYVAVGLGKTMTPLDILEGRMIIEIGMAVVRPAEFIILRFSHKMAES